MRHQRLSVVVAIAAALCVTACTTSPSRAITSTSVAGPDTPAAHSSATSEAGSATPGKTHGELVADLLTLHNLPSGYLEQAQSMYAGQSALQEAASFAQVGLSTATLRSDRLTQFAQALFINHSDDLVAIGIFQFGNSINATSFASYFRATFASRFATTGTHSIDLPGVAGSNGTLGVQDGRTAGHLVTIKGGVVSFLSVSSASATGVSTLLPRLALAQYQRI